ARPAADHAELLGRHRPSWYRPASADHREYLRVRDAAQGPGAVGLDQPLFLRQTEDARPEKVRDRRAVEGPDELLPADPPFPVELARDLDGAAAIPDRQVLAQELGVAGRHDELRADPVDPHHEPIVGQPTTSRCPEVRTGIKREAPPPRPRTGPAGAGSGAVR